ncbi:BACK, BTB, and/or F5 F8 type C domain containing protein, partial [Asbolus verrucosus]
ISSLHLNEEFSDVVFIFDGQKLHAHKAEIPISTFSIEAFRMFLKFIYTGGVIVDPSNMNVTTEVLILAHQHSFKDLESAVMKKMEALLKIENAPAVLNIANRFEYNELAEMCYIFLDEHALEILANDSFNELSQNSLVRLLERHTFDAPEVEIFKSVAKWGKVNDDVDGRAIKSVRLSCLNVVDIVSTVRPSKLVGNEDLLDAITEAVDVAPKKLHCRPKLGTESLQSGRLKVLPAHEAEVIAGTNTEFLLNGNKDVGKFASHVVGDEGGITVKLGALAIINHICMKFVDTDQRHYSYYIEVSTDNKNWKKVVDYSTYACRSQQDLYFDKEVVLYVRIVGTESTADNALHLVFLEADYKSTIPRLVNEIICPTENVASLEKNALVIEGYDRNEMLNGISKIDEDRQKGFTYHPTGKGSIIVQLTQPYRISSMKMLLWDGDNRYYQYYIESSMNKIDWEMVVDRRKDKWKSWQEIKFSERPMIYIKITGTHNSEN